MAAIVRQNDDGFSMRKSEEKVTFKPYKGMWIVNEHRRIYKNQPIQLVRIVRKLSYRGWEYNSSLEK